MENWQDSLNDNPIRLIFTQATNESLYKKVEIRKIVDSQIFFQISQFTATQVFHQNIETEQLESSCEQYFDTFNHLHVFGKMYTWNIRRSKKGKVFVSKSKQEEAKTGYAHNREKRYLLKENEVSLALVDLKIMDESGKVFPSKYEKFKQINRFLELIEDVMSKYSLPVWHIVDFGCGKSYLTFLVYDYLTRIKGHQVSMVGLDLKEDVINHCNQTAQKYGYESLRFEVGDIAHFQRNHPVDMVISLHACDTATDFALFKAIEWQSKIILAVPCCHKELIHHGDFKSVPLVGEFGLTKERISAYVTDNLRAALLTTHGYKTDMVEMIDSTHSLKNICIRAIKGKGSSDQAYKIIDQFNEQFKVTLTLQRLLKEKSDDV